jgi:hypothetical protein
VKENKRRKKKSGVRNLKRKEANKKKVRRVEEFAF